MALQQSCDFPLIFGEGPFTNQNVKFILECFPRLLGLELVIVYPQKISQISPFFVGCTGYCDPVVVTLTAV